MNITERILAKLDELRKRACTHNEMCLDDEYACSSCIVNFSLRRQVEKHPENENGKCGDLKGTHLGWATYPCTFITEVATDLGIEVGE